MTEKSPLKFILCPGSDPGYISGVIDEVKDCHRAWCIDVIAVP